jgi:hypothetical protein
VSGFLKRAARRLPRLGDLHRYIVALEAERDPKEWVCEGRAWNENYILRAFLEFNDAFEVVLFGTWLARFHRGLLAELMPLTLENPGRSLWLKRRS